MKRFPEYFASGGRGFGAFAGSGTSKSQVFCVEPLRYVGQAAIREDLENFKSALQGANSAEAFLPENTSGTIEHWLRNEHYPSDEAFVYAIAEVMARNTARSSMPASCCRSTIPICPTAGRCIPR